ncbi:pyruvate dehydrogenase (quinone) [Palleronia marisminoris]|uniref:Putative thiamine pyrophosphate-containing protein YdaP n=1 Tax=Palleronia marisminoris TaxID=315423 RepID=A0A1Y5SBW8_9RHOB|nr:thiamine pyrophosphate-requiring protein [Palleronia marisminoris]SFG72871.1 pyruvate dehydrogenase (quinone) [Palleronia marisminoris]SLN37234.1 Putative thiamine pyrophosphate-containing protein YdaP [Palleronia marisminoris]
MAKTTADFMLERLTDWGVRNIYGFPGDGISSTLEALEKAIDRFTFVQARHEEEAAFMACAHAKWTGEPGVCLATSGPGAIHLLNGLYDAKLDHQPVVAIVGQQDRAALGGSYQQEVDLLTLFKDVAHNYVHYCQSPAQMRHLIDRAFRIAKAKRCVTAIILPDDVGEEDAVESPPHEHGTVHSGVGYPAKPRSFPPEEELRRAAAILNDAKRPAIMIGAGAMGAGEEVKAVAETLGAGVCKALLGKAALPDDLPYVTGQMGLLGTSPSWDLMMECDAFLMVGSGFPYSEFLPEEGKARGIQIDIDPGMLSIRYPMEVNLVGDSRDTLAALLPYLEHKSDRSWREKIEKNVAKWWEGVEKRAMHEGNPVNPQRLFWECSPRLPDGAIISADSGTSANWYARAIRIREGMKASLSGTLATMCPGVPYATAAKFTHPDRVAVSFVGDGAMQMLGNAALITIAKYWRVWEDPRCVIAVVNNEDLNQVTWEMRAMGGFPQLEETQKVPPFDYAAYAASLGLIGLRVEHPDQVGPAWDQAFAADRPVVIDCVCDATIPTLPPKITSQQRKNYFSTLMKGDPDEGAIIKNAFKRYFTS